MQTSLSLSYNVHHMCHAVCTIYIMQCAPYVSCSVHHLNVQCAPYVSCSVHHLYHAVYMCHAVCTICVMQCAPSISCSMHHLYHAVWTICVMQCATSVSCSVQHLLHAESMRKTITSAEMYTPKLIVRDAKFVNHQLSCYMLYSNHSRPKPI